jgi:hypothetical protein
MKHLILLLLAFSAHVFAVEPLTDAEKKRLVDAERSAKSTPVMREVVAKYRAARTAYTEDQKKPATERDKNASKTYREATAVYEAALKKRHPRGRCESGAPSGETRRTEENRPRQG